MTPDREPQLPGTGQHRHPSRRQVGQQAREQLIEDLRAARQQCVRMPALRNPLPVCRALRQQVAVDNRHPLVGIGQHPGRQQPAHASPKDHSVITDLPHPDQSSLIKPVPAGAVGPPAQVAYRSNARPRTPVTAPLVPGETVIAGCLNGGATHRF